MLRCGPDEQFPRLALLRKCIELVAVNGHKVAEAHLLADGDQAHVYPPFAAGR